jgi:iron complex outermembrane receptor protein
MRFRILLVPFFSAAFLFSLSAEESEPVRKDDAPPRTAEIPPVTVTATKLLQEKHDKSASVTTVTGDQIDHSVVQNIADLSRVVPNFDMKDGGDRRTQLVSMRGLINSTYGDPGVITYVDDIPLNQWRALNIDLFDVESVEVLRGPTAETTHGASAETGLLEIRTRQPGNTLEAEADASYGNYNAQIYRAAVGGPILKDKIMFRFAAEESKRDGYQKNTFLNTRPDFRDSLAGRAQLLFLPAKDVNIELTAEGQRANDGAQTYVLLDSPDRFKVNYNVRGSEDLSTSVTALKFAYTAPDFKITSITSRRSWSAGNSSADFDFSPAPIFTFIDNYNFVQWTQELRLSSVDDKNKNWSWLAGAYFEDRPTNHRFGSKVSDTAFIQTPPPAGLGLPFTAPITDEHETHLFEQAFSTFGQATYTVCEKLNLTVGLRYEFHREEMQNAHNLFAPEQHTVVPVYKHDGERHSNVFLPKFAASYQVEPTLSVYATADEGYRPGGFSYLIDDPKFEQWKPEYLWNFEGGMKSTWLNDRVIFDLSIFDDILRAYQVRRQYAFSFRVDNADRVTTRGLETNLTVRPLKGLELITGVGVADARLDRYKDRQTGENFDGNNLSLTSKYTFSLAAQYLHSTGFFARAEYEGNGRYPYSEDNIRFQSAFQLFNAKLGYERRHFGVYLFGKNLFDRTYSRFGIPGPTGALVGSPGEPRTFGIQATYKF